MSDTLHTIRTLATLDEYQACVALQKEVWGRDFSETVPAAILKVSQELGGVTAGAFAADGRLDGFVFGLTGIDAGGRPVHWSDMLAVRPGVAGRGLATRLKAHQRDALLARGVTRMLWTFDPLRARNAHLNLNKLGAVVREYRPDMYGETDSELHRGIGTDRFVALWEMDSPRVRERMDRSAPQPGGSESSASPVGMAGRGAPSVAAPAIPDAIALCAEDRDGIALPLNPVIGLTARRLTVAVPAELDAVMRRDLLAAVAWREATRVVFTHYLAAGWEVTAIMPGQPAPPAPASAAHPASGFTVELQSNPAAAVACYLLECAEEKR